MVKVLISVGRRRMLVSTAFHYAFSRCSSRSSVLLERDRRGAPVLSENHSGELLLSGLIMEGDPIALPYNSTKMFSCKAAFLGSALFSVQNWKSDTS